MTGSSAGFMGGLLEAQLDPVVCVWRLHLSDGARALTKRHDSYIRGRMECCSAVQELLVPRVEGRRRRVEADWTFTQSSDGYSKLISFLGSIILQRTMK